MTIPVNARSIHRSSFIVRRFASPCLRAFAVCCVILAMSRPASAYVEAAYSLGRLISESTNIVVLQVEKIDKEKNLIIYKKVQDLKGKHPTEIVRHNIGKVGFHPRESQFIMAECEPGKIVVMFHNGSAAETCINNYWYQTYPGGEWWNMIHGEPYLLRSYAGKPEKLIPLVTSIIAGQEVIATCFADGDKNGLSLRTGKIQRLRASLKLLEYNEKRDFVAWGQQEFQRIETMPGFSHLGVINRVDPGALGIVAADFDSNGRMGLCLFGEDKTVLLRPSGNTMEDAPLPYTGGARAAAFADVNGDGKLDLLLATLTGPKLFINEGGRFRDESARLPKEPYYNLTAAAFIDANADGRPDILLANGFLGLRLYHNLLPKTPSTQPAAPSAQPWFEDISAKVALGPTGIAANFKGDHLAVADVNGDGRPDFLYSAGTGVLVLNTPAGFVECKDSGLSFKTGKITPLFADPAGSVLFVPQLDGQCKLYRNDGKAHFTDITAQSGDLAKPILHITSALWVDLARKGRPDLLIGCVKGPNLYFRNNGNNTFSDATADLGLYQRIFNTRSLCVFDMNKDGIPDIAFNNEGQDSTVLVGATLQPAPR